MQANRTLFALALGTLTLAAQPPSGLSPQSRMAEIQALKLPKLVGDKSERVCPLDQDQELPDPGNTLQ